MQQLLWLLQSKFELCLLINQFHNLKFFFLAHTSIIFDFRSAVVQSMAVAAVGTATSSVAGATAGVGAAATVTATVSTTITAVSYLICCM